MWIRLFGVATLGMVISINAMASAASATPTSSVKDPVRHAPSPIVRTYEFDGVLQTARWYTESAPKAETPSERQRPARPARVSHRRAVNALTTAGLRWKSSGHCIDRRVRVCTSLEAVRSETIHDVIALKRVSRCPIMVTGGTEAGHAPGFFSHARGYKLDILHNACIDRYITKNYPKSGMRRDGATLYRAPGGTVFADEFDHWDILFK